jgi:hypothetical protein
MIEAIPIYQLMGRDANHNDFNGFIVFVNFTPNTAADFDKMPSPCTTKVSLYENDPVLTKFKLDFAKIMATVIKDVLAKVEKDKVTASKEKEKLLQISSSSDMIQASSGKSGYEPINTMVVTQAMTKKATAPVAQVPQTVAQTVAPQTVAQTVVTQVQPKPSVVEIPAHQKLAPQSQKDLLLAIQQFNADLQGMNLNTLIMKASNSTEKKIAEKIVAIQEIRKMLKSLAE